MLSVTVLPPNCRRPVTKVNEQCYDRQFTTVTKLFDSDSHRLLKIDRQGRENPTSKSKKNCVASGTTS